MANQQVASRLFLPGTFHGVQAGKRALAGNDRQSLTPLKAKLAEWERRALKL